MTRRRGTRPRRLEQLAKEPRDGLTIQAEVSGAWVFRDTRLRDLPAAHVAGGSRDPQQLLSRLRLPRTVPPGRRVVLVDDALTTGSHLRAAAAFLESRDATIACALCAGRSDDGVTIEDAFSIKTDILESINRPAL